MVVALPLCPLPVRNTSRSRNRHPAHWRALAAEARINVSVWLTNIMGASPYSATVDTIAGFGRGVACSAWSVYFARAQGRRVMRWDQLPRSDNVEDQRGAGPRGFPTGRAGGIGIGTLLV